MYRNLKMVYIILLFISTTMSRIKAIPFRFDGDFEITATEISHLNVHDMMKASDRISTRNRMFSKENYEQNTDADAISRKDGKMIFSTDDDNIEELPYDIPPPQPTCNSTFCEDAPNYPTEVVEYALRMNKHLKFLSGTDLVPEIVHRSYDRPDDVPMCKTYERLVFPKIAQNKNRQWLYVLNQGNFIQGVRIETCRNENKACNIIEDFAEGYKTTCKQKYIYRQLIAVDPKGKISPSSFRFPASCCCHMKYTRNPLIHRMDTSPTKQDK